SQSEPDVVWVGTGEANKRQSASWGNGVYKSKDGGKTWSNMGLKETAHIPRLPDGDLLPGVPRTSNRGTGS
ncbi:MAG: xyloglucanase precursor, partial [Acidobacteriia bacterium]|nr:xyloglucanase precursor [Terriglobia bacterium]